MNNPLKYVDPSGLTDITVTPTQAPPEILWRMDCEGVTVSTVTTANGDTYIVVSGNTPQEIHDAVAKKGNEIRKYEGDKDLNIITRYTDEKGTLYFLDHYMFDKDENMPKLSEKYYFNSNNQWELVKSSDPHSTLSWKNIATGMVGGMLAAEGFFIMYLGCGIMVSAITPPYQNNLFFGGFLGFVGWELFWFGTNFGLEGNTQVPNPFEPIIR